MSFLRKDTPAESQEVARIPTIADHSPHFTREELQCTCGCGECEINYGSLQKLERVRTGYGQPFSPNSAYRCETHNANKGASDTSSHPKGYAFDIPVSNSRDRWKLIWCAIDAGFTRIGDGDGFIHLDDDPDKPENVFFNYYSKKS
jgi:hypothetical protein